MENILNAINQASIEIYRFLSKNETDLGKSNNTNISGDSVHKIDIVSNEIVKNHLVNVPEVYAIASEEEDDIVYCNKNGNYLIAFDPLDGSQNIDPGLEVGSIFGIFKINTQNKNIINSGRNIVGAVYSLYGATLQITKAINNNCTMQIFSPNGNLIKSRYNYKMPLYGKYYCTNEANRIRQSNTRINDFHDKLAMSGLSCRWGGCMVQDVHRILLQGGLFSYPADDKNKNGKLRLLYECYPMAYIIECADGKSYLQNGIQLLDKPFDITNLHEKIPVFLMSPKLSDVFLESIQLNHKL